MPLAVILKYYSSYSHKENIIRVRSDQSIMQLVSFVRDQGSLAFLLLLLTLCNSVVTSQIKETYMKVLKHKRLDVTPREVVTRSSAIRCEATCRSTSWCASANLSPDKSTCHLLSEEVSDVTPLQSAEGWRYLREFKFSPNRFTKRTM